jgi:translocator protein
MKPYLIGNILSLTVVITINTLAIALPINGMTTGQISDLYPSLFTPAGFTFSIWSVIYVLQIGFLVVQFQIRNEAYFKALSKWYWLTCLANATWVLVWQYLFTAVSIIVMFVLLYSLVNIFLLLQRNIMKNSWQWTFVKLTFTVYLSWICVATIANISAWLVALPWQGSFLSEEYWTIIMIVIASILGSFIAYRFNEPSFLLIIMWALFGIYSKWIGSNHDVIAQASRVAIVVLGLMVVKLMVDSRKKLKSY